MNEQRRAAVMRASDPEPEGMKIGWRYRNIALPDMRILTTSKCDGARLSYLVEPEPEVRPDLTVKNSSPTRNRLRRQANS